MKSVLLAVNGEGPSRNALHYAIEFCRKMKADLRVLQVVHTDRTGRTIRFVNDIFQKSGTAINSSMTTLAFSDVDTCTHSTDNLKLAGAKTVSRLSEAEYRKIPCELTVTSGKTAQEVVGYIRDHGDLILAVYDDGHDTPNVRGKKRTKVPLNILKNIEIPMVSVNR